MSPLTPVLFLALGAVAVLLGLLPRFRYTGLIAVAAAVGSMAAFLLMALSLPSRAVLSAWQPAALFGIGLTLEVDALAWLYASGVMAVTLATLVTGLVRPGGRRVGTRAAMLVLVMAGLMSIMSDNLITRALAWALLDLVYFLALIFLAEGDGLEPQAVLNLAFNSAGTLLAVGAAVLISRTSPALSLRDAVLTSQTTLLITLAAVFRLGLFPLHLGLPTELNIRQGLGTLLRLVPAAVALETLSRLAVFGFAPAVRPWLTLFGVAAALAGAAQLWNASDPRQGMVYVILAQSGVALLAGLWGGEQAVLALTAVALSMMLGVTLVFLAHAPDDQRPWPTALPLLGVGAVLGLPLTIGFVGVGSLYSGLIQSGGLAWLVLLGLVVAQAILAAGLLYTVFWPGLPLAGEPVTLAVHLGGLTLPAVLVALMAMFVPMIAAVLGAPSPGPFGLSGAPSLAAGALVVLTAAGGFLLWRFEDMVRERSGLLAGVSLASLGRLHWLYRLAWTGIRSVGSGVDNVAGVLEGEGAILWTLVAGVLVWLLLQQ